MIIQGLIILVSLLTGSLTGSNAFAAQNVKIEAKVLPTQEQNAIADQAKSKLEALAANNEKARKNLIEQGRLTYFIGQYLSKDDDKLTAFERGMQLLEPLAKEVSDPEAALIWAANAGGVASIKRNLDALRLMEKIDKRLLGVSEKNPSYEGGAADRALASVYLNAPSFISVGSKKKAAIFAHKAFAQDPKNPANMLVMAHIEADDGDQQKAVELYQAVLDAAKPERYPFDYAQWHNEAVEGLGDVGALKS